MIVVKVGGSVFNHPRLGPGLRAYLDSLAPSKVLLVPGGGPVVDAVRELDRLHGLGEETSHWLAVRAMDVMGGVLERALEGEQPGLPRPSSAPTGPQVVAQGVSPGPVAQNTRRPEGATHSGACAAPSGLQDSFLATQGLRPGLLSDAPLGRREDGRDKPGHSPGPSRIAILDCLAFLQDDETRPGALPHSWSVTSDSIAARAGVILGVERLVLLKSVDMPPGTSWDEAAARGWVDEHFPRVVVDAGFTVEVVNFRRVVDSLPL